MNEYQLFLTASVGLHAFMVGLSFGGFVMFVVMRARNQRRRNG